MIPEVVMEDFKDKHVLVTGGTGLIGRQVVDILLSADAKVTIASLDTCIVDSRSKHIYVDLCDFKSCLDLTDNVDYVCHLAGIKGSIKVTTEKPASFFVPLVMMNTNMLEACFRNGIRKLVYTSSVGAYSSAEVFKEDENLDGSPMDMFPGLAKRMAEKQIEAYKIQHGMTNFAVVRPSNVYGPGDNFNPENAMVVPSLMSRIHRGENPVIVWGDGTAIRDFVYSRDVAEGILLALHFGTDGKFVNLGNKRGYSVKELVKGLQSFLDFEYKFDTSKPAGFPKRVMDISLAQSSLGYDPCTTLEEGLKKTWDWFMENSDEHLKKKNYFIQEVEKHYIISADFYLCRCM